MTKTAAILTLKAPGRMTDKGRKDIAAWLRRQATDLVKLGKQYSDKKLVARYHYGK